ncbi:hypothetical protein [Hymenobacter sp. HDW8]|uniref:hypothetical protein n=1 Tax=Hymenobacter sp. HDW8 TaxID=2714932 RepID=UPI0014088274|nr:hypothetical protein [Hymenobacter sp. HDW8]QIL78401.1 hypothetical protein G7064_21505 [Hymenobacter sp. HDW8]
MSKHLFSSTTRAGQRVNVQCGWDRPLQHHYLTVFAGEAVPENVLYTSLMERGGLPDVDSLADHLEELSIEAPEGLYERLWLDAEFNESSNEVKQW